MDRLQKVIVASISAYGAGLAALIFIISEFMRLESLTPSQVLSMLVSGALMIFIVFYGTFLLVNMLLNWKDKG